MGSSLSVKEHQLLLDAIKDHAIFMMDTEGNIISWNEGAKRLKGYDEEEVIGVHFRLLFRPEDVEKGLPENELKEALKSGRYEGEWWRMRKGGSVFWAHIILQPVFDDNNNHIGFAKITTDITSQKRINELNDFLMNEVAGYAIFLLDKEGKVEKWSKAAESIIGYGEEEVMGRSLTILYPRNEGEDSGLIVEQHLAKALSDRYEEEGWKVKKNGDYFWANYIVTPLHNKDGYVVMIRDLTDKRAFEQASIANKALLASNEQLEHFAFVTSHQLKEPVRKIATLCYMLKADDPDQQSLIDKIRNSCNRMGDLLNDLLELSLVTQIKPAEKQDLNEILRTVLDNLSEEIREKEAEIEHTPLPVAPAIPGQMEQLMHNLISNALKFCCGENQVPKVFLEGAIIPKEKLDPKIVDTVTRSDHYLQLRVQDNGIGFDQDYSSNIFKLFKRLHGSAAYEGNGIGLFICKRIADNHGGNITVFSEKGKGTLFVITLPFYDDHNSVY